MRNRYVTNQNTKVDVLATIVINARISMRQIARDSSISQSSNVGILTHYCYHPYRCIKTYIEMTFKNELIFTTGAASNSILF